MRELLRTCFGEQGNNALVVSIDGRDWVSARSLCDLMGTSHEYNLVGDQWVWTEMNLTPADKRKFYDDRAHRICPVWFVSETGFWKIVARSNSLWARKFRASFLPM